MKRGLLIASLVAFAVSLIGFVSAQFYSGYGRFSLRGLFDTTDPQTIVLGTLFFVFFALLFYALGKVFKDSYGYPNKGIAGVIALGVSFLIIYGIYRSGFDISNMFFRIGVPADFFYSILPFILLALAILLIWKLGFGWFLMIFGIFIFAISVFTDVIYEKTTAIIIGLVFFLIGLFLWRRKRKKKGKISSYDYRSDYDYGYPKSPKKGMFSKWHKQRSEISEARHQQKVEYERQKAEQKYQQKLHDKEARRRAENIARIRERKEKRGAEREENIVYQKKQRSLYDLKQKLNSYKFEYNNARGNPQRQKRIKQAMKIIEKEIRRLS